MARPPFPFIVASGRSGTTLLQAMLDSHPDMAIPPEAHFLVPLSRRVRRVNGRLDTGHLTWLLRRSQFAIWGLPPDEVEAALAEARPVDYAEAIRAVYASFARRRGKRRYGDKTPKHVGDIPYLARMFPEGRFIHMIRDGRDVTCSFVAHRLGPRNAAEGALRWKRAVEAGRRAGRDLGPDRYLEVRYEALVEDPRGQLEMIGRFIHLDFDERMLEYHRHAERLLPTSQLQDLHRNLSRPPRPGLRDWRREMEPPEVAVFEALAGDLLEALGYPRATSRVPWAARLRAGRDWASFQARRGARKLQRAAGRSRRAGIDPQRQRAGA